MPLEDLNGDGIIDVNDMVAGVAQGTLTEADLIDFSSNWEQAGEPLFGGSAWDPDNAYAMDMGYDKNFDYGAIENFELPEDIIGKLHELGYTDAENLAEYLPDIPLEEFNIAKKGYFQDISDLGAGFREDITKYGFSERERRGRAGFGAEGLGEGGMQYRDFLETRRDSERERLKIGLQSLYTGYESQVQDRIMQSMESGLINIPDAKQYTGVHDWSDPETSYQEYFFGDEEQGPGIVDDVEDWLDDNVSFYERGDYTPWNDDTCVITTAAYNQGFISKKELMSFVLWRITTQRNAVLSTPIYLGYQITFRPIAKLMYKSKSFAKFIYNILIKDWSRQINGKTSWLAAPFIRCCSLIGFALNYKKAKALGVKLKNSDPKVLIGIYDRVIESKENIKHYASKFIENGINAYKKLKKKNIKE